MLTKEDLKHIGEEMGKVIEQNIFPLFETLNTKIDDTRSEMRSRFDSVDRRFDRLEGKTNNLINTLQEKEVITGEDKLRILS